MCRFFTWKMLDDMNVWIIEDEAPAVNRLKKLIEDIDPGMQIREVTDSVESAVSLFKNRAPELLFLDIHLADGLSFEIFKQCEVNCPIIFTTAYDQYTLKAFKLNSIDYLLKPIDREELAAAISKFKTINKPAIPAEFLSQLAGNWQAQTYRERFLIKMGEQLSYVPTEDIAYFYSEGGMTRIATTGVRRDIISGTLDELEKELDPKKFRRISRKCIVQLDAISTITKWHGGRLKLALQPEAEFEVLVSRERVAEFQSWLDR